MPFTLRLEPQLQRLAAIAAASRRQSMSAWITAAIRAQILRDARGKAGAAIAAALEATERTP